MLLGLAACGGGGNDASTGLVRVVNTTQNHASVDLLTNSTVVVPGTAKDNASTYAGVAAGSPTLQVNDAGTATALTTIAPTVSGNLHYAVIVYESNGLTRAAVLGEDNTAPAAGSSQLRIFDAAPEAGALDVYVTDPAAALTSPSFTLTASGAASTTNLLTFGAGTYRIRVTGQGNVNDLRLDIPSVTVASQQIATLVLNASKGGVLLDGGVLVQQGAYTASRNTNARVRLATGVTGAANVGAVADGTVVVSPPVTSPAVGAYTVVPASSALTINVNGVVTPVTGTLTAGSDATLLVTGAPGAPTATLLTDDNHLPSTTAVYKMRLVNGLSGAATSQTLTADFAVIAAGVQPNTASAYGTGQGSTAVRLDVQPANLTTSNLNILNNAVYSVFLLGDAAAPVQILRRDR
jgi:hypothetical protein